MHWRRVPGVRRGLIDAAALSWPARASASASKALRELKWRRTRRGSAGFFHDVGDAHALKPATADRPCGGRQDAFVVTSLRLAECA